MTKYIKKVSCILMLLFAFGFVGQVDSKAFAGNFETLASTGFLELGNDEKWEKTYKTTHGKFKIRFRKLLLSSDAKRYHLLIWWNDKKITDGYCPDNGVGYGFQVFHDRQTDRLFVAIDAVQRMVLFGYDPINKKMEKFVDSRNYYTVGKYPYMSVDSDKDLMLTFKDNKWNVCNKYKLFWDKSANWFGYRDVSPRWEPPVQSAPSYTPPTYRSYHEPTTTEIYYEDEEVVGS